MDGRLPSLVLEVASDSSESKDERLVEKYFAAGVGEYWRIDARADPVQFTILRRGPAGFVPVPRRGGRMKSTVFGRSFRLVAKNEQHLSGFLLE
jgi:Uma2 family endonuclease